MNILLTGATGFIGAHVARRLVKAGHRVRALVRRSSRPDNLAGLDLDTVSGDLRDQASLRAAVSGCEAVVHTAADYRLWSRDPEEIYASNVQGTVNLFQAVREEGVARVVYTSTVGTIGFSLNGDLPNESTPVSLGDMIGHYKRSKYLAEQEALRFAAEGLPVVIVNPTAPVGELDIRPTPTGRIITDFLNGRIPAYVDTGLNVVDVEDVAEGHLLALERGTPGQRYILGGRNMSLKEILGLVARASGRRAPRWRVPFMLALAAGLVDNGVARLTGAEPRIPLDGVRMARKRMFVDASRATRDLGLVPRPVEPAVERAVDWFTRHGYVGAR